MIESLAFVAVKSPNAGDWAAFAELIGAVSDETPDGAIRVRIDERPWRLSVEHGDADELVSIGWDVTADSFDALTASLERAGLPPLTIDDELAAARSAAGAAWTVDPWGVRNEFVFGVSESPVPDDLNASFVTGTQGMGHLVLMVPDLSSADDYVTNVLGLRLSDVIEVGSGLRFYHCQSAAARHHSLAFSEVPGRFGLHHVMVELADLDDVGRSLDRVRSAGHDLAMDYGRHPNDLVTSFYVRTPSGFELEVGSGGVVINDATWETSNYDAMSIWGHRPPADGPLRPGVLSRIPESGA